MDGPEAEIGIGFKQIPFGNDRQKNKSTCWIRAFRFLLTNIAISDTFDCELRYVVSRF